MEVTLRKVHGGSAFRTDVVQGTCFNYPEVGKCFEMVSESLTDPEAIRVTHTSTVQDITPGKDGSLVIKTLNSTYELSFK